MLPMHYFCLFNPITTEMAIHKLKFFAGRQSRYLAEKIAQSYGTDLGDSSVLEFSDGEFQPAFNESIRGCTVFIIQSTFPPTDNLMELLLMIDAARRASAYKVIAVIPYFGWARQDRKDKPRVSIGAKLVANLLHAAGVDRIMTMDLHADQIQGFFDIPVDHIYASGIFIPYIKKLKLQNLSFAAPDMGGAKRVHAYSQFLNVPRIISHKQRERANVIGSMTAIGDVEGRDIVILDDMIDTAGTVTKAADMMMEKGATSVRACATHAVLSGPAYDRINKSSLQEVIVTDTIPLKAGEDVSKFTVLSVADVFADVMERVHNYKEISSRFIF
jgi:ribose-phosphate pyrophosphokinase